MLKAVNNESLNVINSVVLYMLLNIDQVDVPIDHSLCGNLYARHCLVPKDVVIVGALLKVPTAIIIHGDCIVYDGLKTQRITGYHVLMGQAYRQSIFRALLPTHITMLATVMNSNTPEDAEKLITDLHLLLTNHRQELLE